MVAAVVGGIGFLVVPMVPASKVERVAHRGVAGDARSGLMLLAADATELPAVRAYLAMTDAAARSNALAVVRREVSEFLGRYELPASLGLRSTQMLNPFTGRRAILEASPGNVSLVASNQSLELVWHDFDGAPVYRFDVPRLGDPAAIPAEGEPGAKR